MYWFSRVSNWSPRATQHKIFQPQFVYYNDYLDNNASIYIIKIHTENNRETNRATVIPRSEFITNYSKAILCLNGRLIHHSYTQQKNKILGKSRAKLQTFSRPSAVIISFQLFIYSPGNLSLLKTPTVFPSLLDRMASNIFSKLALLLSFYKQKYIGYMLLWTYEPQKNGIRSAWATPIPSPEQAAWQGAHRWHSHCPW